MQNKIDTGRMWAQLKLHEGLRLKRYKCTAGYNTIGCGRNIDAHPLPPSVGPNEITLKQAIDLWSTDIQRVYDDLDKHCPWWTGMSEVRQRVLADLCFNLGWTRLSQFKNTLGAMKRGDWLAAHDGMLKSKWAAQVGDRAFRLAKMMRTNQDSDDF